MNSGLMMSSWGRKVAKQLMKGNNRKLKRNEMQKTNRWNIVSGDVVKVIQGPQEGQQGKVVTMLRHQNRVIIEGVNMRRRAVKPGMDGTPGKMVTRPCAVAYSNIMLVDPTTGEPTKITRRFLEDGTKVRISKASGQVIPKPDPLVNRAPRNSLPGPHDTLPEDVFEVTFEDYELYLPHIYESKKETTEGDDDEDDDIEKEEVKQAM
jgi:large subunit ribosomal protein L24